MKKTLVVIMLAAIISVVIFLIFFNEDGEKVNGVSVNDAGYIPETFTTETVREMLPDVPTISSQARKFNRIKQFEVFPGTPLTITANTANRIEYAIIGGDADVEIDGVTVNYSDGSDTISADELIAVTIKFTVGAGRVVGHYKY